MIEIVTYPYCSWVGKDIDKRRVYLPNPFDSQPSCKCSETGVNSDFYFSYTKDKELSLHYYLPTAYWKINGFTSFLRSL